MPKGQTIISWTADNESKLLLAILTVHDIKVNHAAVAAIFGPHIPASCIATKMSAIRKKAAKMGVTATPTPLTTNQRSAPSTADRQPKKAVTADSVQEWNPVNEKPNTLVDDMLSAQHHDGNGPPTTPPETPANEDCITVNHELSTPTPVTKAVVLNAANQVIAGRVTKKRVTPRKLVKLDYRHLDDPFATMDANTDGDGEKVFGEAASSGEDSTATDDAFEGRDMEGNFAIEA